MTSHLRLTITFALALGFSCQARAGSSSHERELIEFLNTNEDSKTLHSGQSSGYLADSSQDLLSRDAHANSPTNPMSYASRDQSLMGDRSDWSRFLESPMDSYASLDRLRSLLGPGESTDETDGSLLETEKRYKPIGFQASRGKRFIPGLQSLLLANYYQDAKMLKRQHSGYHASRG